MGTSEVAAPAQGQARRATPTSALDQRLEELLSAPVHLPSTGDLHAMVQQVLNTMIGDLTLGDIKLYKELEALAAFIQNAKAEIAAVRPAEISEQHIPRATDELDAVVGATEEATGSILDACEALETFGGTLANDQRDEISAIVTRIYEACNFQDLTGQRINKVVRTLKEIELRVAALIAAFGEETSKETAAVPIPVPEPVIVPGPHGESALLNGPQLPDEAKKQAEIDAILASFG